MKLSIKIYIAAISLLSLFGCYDDPGNDILFENADTFIEWEESTLTGADIIIIERDGEFIRDTLSINVVTRDRSSVVNINFEMVDSLTSALPGVHFNLLSGTQVAISSGVFTGLVPYEILDDSLAHTETLFFTLRLLDASDGSSVNPNFQDITIQFTGFDPDATCVSEIPTGTWTLVNPVPLGAGESPRTTFSRVDGTLDEYEVENMSLGYYPNFPAVGRFRHDCLKDGIDVFGFQPGPGFVKWLGTGTYDPSTQSITVEIADAEFAPNSMVTQKWQFVQ